jgi:hypothetical protein
MYLETKRLAIHEAATERIGIGKEETMNGCRACTRSPSVSGPLYVCSARSSTLDYGRPDGSGPAEAIVSD